MKLAASNDNPEPTVKVGGEHYPIVRGTPHHVLLDTPEGPKWFDRADIDKDKT